MEWCCNSAKNRFEERKTYGEYLVAGLVPDVGEVWFFAGFNMAHRRDYSDVLAATKAASAALEEIAESLEGDVTIEPDWLSEHVGVLTEDRVRIDPNVWAQMAEYIERREVIRVTYQIFDGRVSDYELHPYHLLAYHGNWYLMARNTHKEHVATFALSRFKHIEGAGKRFARPANFNPDAYARKAFGIVGGEKPLKVRLLFKPKLAVYITERQWHPSQEFHLRRDGRIEMKMETTGRKELVRWVLSWMPDVKVLAPKSLRDRITEKLQDGLQTQE